MKLSKKVINGVYILGLFIFLTVSMGFVFSFALSTDNSPDSSGIASNPRLAAVIDEQNSSMSLSDPMVWISNASGETLGKLNIKVEDVICWSSIFEPYEGNEMNSSHIGAAVYSVIDNNNMIVKTGDLYYENISATDGYWYTNDTTVGIPEGGPYTINVSFSEKYDRGYAYKIVGLYFIEHSVVINFSFDFISDGQAHLILTKTFNSYTGDKITDNDLDDNSKFNYTVYRADTNETVSTGYLEYSEGRWAKTIIADGLYDDCYIVLSVHLKGYSSVFSTPNEYTNSTKLQGAPPRVSGTGGAGNYMIYILIAAGVIAAVLIGVFLLIKKRKAQFDITKEPKKDSSNAIEIVDISAADLKKTRLTPEMIKQKKKSGKKKKVKDINEGGLIFDVPTWEVDEEEEEETQTEEAEKEAGAPGVQLITMHCPGCNSWYEIDQYAKIECPKCGEILELAMWCDHCQKWFDVPEPSEDIRCPLCNAPLKYRKD